MKVWNRAPIAKIATTADVSLVGKSKKRKGKPQHLFKQKAKRVKASINAL